MWGPVLHALQPGKGLNSSAALHNGADDWDQLSVFIRGITSASEYTCTRITFEQYSVDMVELKKSYSLLHAARVEEYFYMMLP